MEKNIAGKWIVFAYGLPDHASPGQAITGDAANITANVRIDGGAANAVDDTNPTELEDGYYIFDLTATETNGDLILLAPASATANVQVIGVPGTQWTRPPNFNAFGIASDGDISGNVDGAVVGAVGSVTGAVGSVTGNIGGDVQGNIDGILAGHTPQTGDSFARIGAPNNVSISMDLGDIRGATFSAGTDSLEHIKDAQLSAAQINAEVDTALADIHLDHFFAVDYDPASKPGTATAWANELVESDAGVSRFTVNALENAPSGSGASAETIADAVWDELLAGHVTADSAGLLLNEWQDGGRLDLILDARMAEASINTTAGAVDNVTLVATTTTNTDMRGTDSAATSAKQDTMETTLNDVPTTAEFNARTLAAAAYFDPAVDAVANVTLVGTTTTNTDMRGTDSAATAAALATAQTDLDTITGSDGATLATAQGNYAPAKASDILTTQLTEAYAADGVAPTLVQALFAIQQFLFERVTSGTTVTVKKIDGSTTAATLTLNDATTPTSITRAT